MAVFAGEQPAGRRRRRLARRATTFRRFDAADRYLFSVPMWNAGVPYILKQFIDVVSQPGMVFGFDPDEGYTRPADRQEGGGDLHQRRLRAGGRPRSA